MRRFTLSSAVIVAALWLSVASGADAPSFQEIEESLTCQCGCGLTVHSCNHLQCGSALPLRDEIRAEMAAGKDKVSILDHFREKYGEKILSAPTTSGFNLAAWVMPFVMVIAGGLFVAFTVRRWQRPAVEVAGSPPAEIAASKEHQKILERELRQLDE